MVLCLRQPLGGNFGIAFAVTDGDGLGGLHLTLAHYFVELRDYDVSTGWSEGAHDCHSRVAKLLITGSSLGRRRRLQLFFLVALLTALPEARSIIVLAELSLVASCGRHSLAVELNLFV